MAMNQVIRYKTIIDYINTHKPKNILEVWSWSKWIWKFMRNLQFTWIDKTTSDYGNMELNTPKNMTYINWDSINMPFDNNSFDLVFSLDMLEHIKKEDRLKAMKDSVRVSNNTCIIAFPYWKFWSLIDKLFYEYYITKDWKVEWRLKEHIENELPDEDFINLVKKEFDIYKVTEINNWNIFFVIFTLVWENIRLISIFLTLLSFIIIYIPFIKFDSKYWIRKYLIIEKIIK